MFENRSQQSKTEVKAQIERNQNSSHEQTCFLLEKNLYNINTPLRVVKTTMQPIIATIAWWLLKRKTKLTKIN